MFSIIENKAELFEDFLTVNECKYFFDTLSKNINWKHESIKIFGKNILQPRLTGFYGDKNISYSYSGIKMNADFWNNDILELKNRIEKQTKYSFNSCLLNYYRDGNDSMGWHQDNEKELGINPVIASISLGETRRFQIKNILNDEKIDVPLNNGSLLIMKGDLQHTWKHQIPKERKKYQARINLTFRKIN